MARSKGFSLVEVLVAVVLLSIGLLGLAKLQFWGVRHTGSAYFRTQATQIASEMAERLRANPIGVATGEYELNPDGCKPAACPISTTRCRIDPDNDPDGAPPKVCQPEELALFDLQELACGANGSGAANLLPSGGMRVRCSDTASGTKLCRIEVCWREAEETETANGSSNVVLEIVP